MSSRPEGARPTREWFEDAFDDLYLSLYAHRDQGEARALIATLLREHALAAPTLDLCCGGGRFLAVAREAGQVAFGLDLSAPLLRAAKRTAPGVGLVRGDMRVLPYRAGTFGSVLLLFTSFGYFESEAEDSTVLAEVTRVLRDGGTLALDFLNAAELRRTLVPHSEREVNGIRVVESRRIDEAGPFVRKEVTVGDPPQKRFSERVRLYDSTSLTRLIESLGLRIELLLGGYQGASFEVVSSPRLIVIARKEAR